MVETVVAPPATVPLLRRIEHRLVAALHRGVATHYLRKPELSELLAIKFPDAGSVAWAALNEVAFRMKFRRTARLLSLNVETTNYCNLRCTICPVNRGMVRQKRYLDPALFRSLVDRTPTLRFILPFQWGEPLLHPEIDAMVRYAADRGIRSMLTTNGTLLDDAMAGRLLASGLDRLTVSVDGDDATHERIREFPLQELRERVAALKRRRDAGRHRLRIDVSMVLDEETLPALASYRAQWQGIADRVQVIPRLAEGPRRNPCREPWRGSLVVLVDGTVTACCADSEGRLALGNAHRDAPARILNDAPLRELRRRHACRDFPEPCHGCSEFDGGGVGVHARFDR
jgi:MoaA/NifB/PqqE/SkfB family radical SAM enzyme